MGIRAASRYAKAVFTLSIERNELDAVYADMSTISKVCKENRELQLMLKSPVVPPSKKATILQLIFDEPTGKTASSFLQLLAEKKRANLIIEIANSFIEEYNKHKNILIAKVSSVIKLDDDIKNKIIAIIDTDAKVILEEEIDKELIGGFVLRFGDNQIDSSIKREFSELKKSFENNPYEVKY